MVRAPWEGVRATLVPSQIVPHLPCQNYESSVRRGSVAKSHGGQRRHWSPLAIVGVWRHHPRSACVREEITWGGTVEVGVWTT